MGIIPTFKILEIQSKTAALLTHLRGVFMQIDREKSKFAHIASFSLCISCWSSSDAALLNTAPRKKARRSRASMVRPEWPQPHN